MSLIQQLADFDMRRGKPPIDPTRIEGFGPDAPPAPQANPREASIPSARELHGEPLELPEENVTPIEAQSPLVEAGLRGIERGPEARGFGRMRATIEEADLWVSNESAAYKGRAVTLNAKEQAQVSKVILKAIRRSLDEQYEEVAGRLPRRRRGSLSVPRSTTGPETPKDTSTSIPRRRRVSRKSLLDAPSA